MKRRLLLATAALVLTAGLATADAFSDKVVADLQAMGYEFIEVKRGVSQLKIEAIRGTRKLEVIYDLATGDILKQETERADANEIGRTGVEIKTTGEDITDDEKDDAEDVNDDDEDDDDHDNDNDNDDDDDKDDDNDDDGEDD